MEWLYLENKATGGTTTVPGEPGVREWHEARGWKVAERPKEDIFVPSPGNADPDGNTEWVTLYHPAVGATHDFPNNVEAIEGAKESGWEYPPEPPAPEDPPAGGNETPEPDPVPKTRKSRTANATANDEKENG